MRRFLLRIAGLFRVRHADGELSREMETHLVLMQEDLQRRGMPADQAKLAARRACGGPQQTRELHREARTILWLDHLLKDIRYGVRNLLRTPGFTSIAVLTLALGIGANTAIFSVVNAVLLQPLGYSDAAQLVTVLHGGAGPVATANYIDWRDRSQSFTAMGAADFWTANLTGAAADDTGAERLYALKVTQNLLPLLGIQPLIGRLFEKGDDLSGADHKVILSYGLWQRRFHGDRSVPGQIIILNGEAYTIVGVMPRDFQFAPFWATRAELWAPNNLSQSLSERSGNHLRVFARLKPGVSLERARADMALVTRRLESQFPATNRNVVVRPLKENVVGKVETPLLTILCAVGFVLLMACVNVAHMLLARTSDREKEIAVRVALGAGKVRLTAQFLTENLVLAAAGAFAGYLFAVAGTKALVALKPGYLPRVALVSVDTRAVLFLLAVTVLTAIAFGMVPALRAAAGNLSASLKEGSRGGSEGVRRHRLRNILVASEFALAFVLLIGAGLMVRSFEALQSIDPGFNPHNVLSVLVSVAGTNEEKPSLRAGFYRDLLRKVESLPGVSAAGAINHLPVVGDLWGKSFLIEGQPAPGPGEAPQAVYRLVMPGYFKTMQLRVRGGRGIEDRDDTRAPGVVVVNERAARQYWPGTSPVGKRITLDAGKSATREWLTVIGVVTDATQDNWANPPDPEIYLSAMQSADFLGTGSGGIGAHMNYITLVLRTDGDPAAMSAAARRTIWSIDRNLPVSQVITMDEAVAEANAQPRFEMLLLSLFGAIALVLATVGIYGVMNYSVSRRTREMGIRISLGATRGSVLGMVIRQAMAQAFVGTAIGIGASLFLSKLMGKMLYGVRPADPLTFACVTIILGIAALIATGVPARRAARVEPVIALRSE